MVDHPPDGMIVAGVLAGDSEQFALLVRRYHGPLARLAYSRLERYDWAEEVVQETFLCAFKSLRTYDSRYSFRTWLWTILINQCRGYLKKVAKRQGVSTWTDSSGQGSCDDWAELAHTDATPVDSLLAAERTELLDRLLRQLPDEQADALRLRFFGDLKFREISDAMNCSLSTAKNRVRWGLEKISTMLAGCEATAGEIRGLLP